MNEDNSLPGDPDPSCDGCQRFEYEKRDLLSRLKELEQLLPRCSGEWLKGSGGHRYYAHDCGKPGMWDVGGQYVCDAHRNTKGGDDEAWRWPEEREALESALTEVCDLFDTWADASGPEFDTAQARVKALRPLHVEGRLMQSASRIAALESALAEACDLAMEAIEDNAAAMPTTNSCRVGALRLLLPSTRDRG